MALVTRKAVGLKPLPQAGGPNVGSLAAGTPVTIDPTWAKVGSAAGVGWCHSADLVEAPQPACIGYYSLNDAAPWNQSTASGFAARFGIAPGLAHTFIPIVDTTTPPSNEHTDRSIFDPAWANDAISHGVMPLFSHELRDHRIAMRVPQPTYSLDAWLSGANDAPLTRWLQAAGTWGHPFLYRFGWEMTAGEYVWGVNFPGNSAGKYIDFWRHVVTLQRRYAPLGQAVWCPSVILPANAKLSAMADCWPGPDWVEVVGLDGYITGNVSASGPDRSFADLFAASVAEVQRIAPTKPILICETGVNPNLGAYSVDWLNGIPSALAGLPAVRGICLFDANQSIVHNEPQRTAVAALAALPSMRGTW